MHSTSYTTLHYNRLHYLSLYVQYMRVPAVQQCTIVCVICQSKGSIGIPLLYWGVCAGTFTGSACTISTSLSLSLLLSTPIASFGSYSWLPDAGATDAAATAATVDRSVLLGAGAELLAVVSTSIAVALPLAPVLLPALAACCVARLCIVRPVRFEPPALLLLLLLVPTANCPEPPTSSAVSGFSVLQRLELPLPLPPLPLLLPLLSAAEGLLRLRDAVAGAGAASGTTGASGAAAALL